MKKMFFSNSQNEDLARREFILNILLIVSIFLISFGIIFHIILVVFNLFDPQFHNTDTLSLWIEILILIFFILLYILSHKGFFSLASYFLLATFFLLSSYMGYQWGVDVSASLLFYAIIIVMAGILINARFAFITVFIIGITISITAYIQSIGMVKANRYWTTDHWRTTDVIITVFLFMIIATVSWLSNREIEKSLARARKSEAELKTERDSLEAKVEERTLELKTAQLKQISQLYRFAEFGKLSSGFFHDIINPLTVASLNIAQIEDKHNAEIGGVKSYFDKAAIAIKRMEDFTVNVRKQMSNQKTESLFSLEKEINSVIQIIDYRIKKANVEIIFSGLKDIVIYGDASKFNQIVLNLLTNAIDSYEKLNVENSQKKVKIDISLKDEIVCLTVTDWGCGIAPNLKDKIFQPFFTTKNENAGMGIGLYLIKNIVENNFSGTVDFKSEENNGSVFTVNFPIKNKLSDNPINYLLNEQQENGSFFVAEDVDILTSTGFILICLNNINETPEIKDIKRKAIKFLLSKKDDDWRFSENIGINFLVLSAIAGYDIDIIDGSAIAKILMLLAKAEEKEGGPYRSDIQKQDQKIDLMTNIAVAYFLALKDVDLPELNNLIESAIENSNFKSELLQSIYPSIYLISIFYKGDKKDKLIKFILEKKEERTRQIDIWLADLALENLKKDKRELVSHKAIDENETKMMELILKTAEKKFVSLEEDVKKLALREIQKTIEGNKDGQMSLMSYYFKKALGGKAEKFSDEFIAEMGIANIFFWTAFIIYDDFWDEDEAANPQILPIANLYARHYVDFFDFVLPESTGFRVFFHKLMNNLDAANAWENMNCRARVEGSKFFIPEKLPEYRDYEFKFRPASGHILGPIAMLAGLGYSLDSAEVKNTIAYFKNYLIAMQINDDAHDWEEDLKRGHISTVVDILLRDLDGNKKEIDLNADLNELRNIFWFKTMPKAEKLALFYAEKAKQALSSIGIFEDLSPLEKFIDINKNVAKKAIKEQIESVKFLQNFN